MGYSEWRPWVVTLLDTITGLNVYDHPTDDISYPAAIVKIGEAVPDIDRETNQSIKRNYEINIDLVVTASEELQSSPDTERIFGEMLDSMIEIFDAVENRHPNDNQASRQRLVRVVPRDSISPEPKRIATLTLEFYKRNG